MTTDGKIIIKKGNDLSSIDANLNIPVYYDLNTKLLPNEVLTVEIPVVVTNAPENAPCSTRFYNQADIAYVYDKDSINRTRYLTSNLISQSFLSMNMIATLSLSNNPVQIDGITAYQVLLDNVGNCDARNVFYQQPIVNASSINLKELAPMGNPNSIVQIEFDAVIKQDAKQSIQQAADVTATTIDLTLSSEDESIEVCGTQTIYLVAANTSEYNLTNINLAINLSGGLSIIPNSLVINSIPGSFSNGIIKIDTLNAYTSPVYISFMVKQSSINLHSEIQAQASYQYINDSGQTTSGRADSLPLNLYLKYTFCHCGEPINVNIPSNIMIDNISITTYDISTVFKCGITHYCYEYCIDIKYINCKNQLCKNQLCNMQYNGHNKILITGNIITSQKCTCVALLNSSSSKELKLQITDYIY